MIRFSPMLAEIGDKMPPIETVWLSWTVIAFFISTLTWAVSSLKLRYGAVLVVFSAAFALLNVLPDRAMEPDIVRELGEGYLWQQRLTGFIPLLGTLAVWTIAGRLQKRNRLPSKTGSQSI